MTAPRTAPVRTRRAGGVHVRYALVLSTMALVAFGLVMIYSASSVADYVKLHDSAYHLRRQLIWIAAGIAALLFFDRFDYRNLRKLAWTGWWVVIGGLLAVRVVGDVVQGSRRWIDVGGFQIQPSEYAKLACVLVVAWVMTQYRQGKLPWGETVRKLLWCTVPVLGLVILQPDMGTTMAIALAVFATLVLGGLEARYIVGVSAAGVALAAFAMFVEPYRAERFFAFLNPWKDAGDSGYQIIQGLLAFGSGGLSGVGLGLSRQKFLYLPAAHTDFIFAIVGEELGLLGTLSVVFAFGVFAYAGFRIATGSKDPFGRLVAGGLTAMIVMQAVLNMAAVTQMMPVTGIPLPLVSYGGSSLTFTLACIGMILSVSRYGARLTGVRARPRPAAEEVRVEVPAERGRDRRSRPPGSDGRRRAAR